MKRLCLVAVLVYAALLSAQGGKAPLSFEVASVKKSAPGGRGGGIRPTQGGQTYVGTNVPVRLMIKLMYGITDAQIQGEPDWVNTELYDVRAKAEKPSNINELHEMFQTLLADRFQLKFHKETKTIGVYELSVDKKAKMRVNESTEAFADFPIKGAGRFKVAGQRVSTQYLSWWLSNQLNRPVIDKTGLAGFFDFDLEFVPEPPPGFVPNPNEPAPEGPSIYTALREQLGLKLDSSKGPVVVFVIDKVERPTEN